jgi:hypothetical protein
MCPEVPIYMKLDHKQYPHNGIPGYSPSFIHCEFGVFTCFKVGSSKEKKKTYNNSLLLTPTFNAPEVQIISMGHLTVHHGKLTLLITTQINNHANMCNRPS